MAWLPQRSGRLKRWLGFPGSLGRWVSRRLARAGRQSLRLRHRSGRRRRNRPPSLLGSRVPAKESDRCRPRSAGPASTRRAHQSTLQTASRCRGSCPRRCQTVQVRKHQAQGYHSARWRQLAEHSRAGRGTAGAHGHLTTCHLPRSLGQGARPTSASCRSEPHRTAGRSSRARIGRRWHQQWGRCHRPHH